jgi:hypothetical protein
MPESSTCSTCLKILSALAFTGKGLVQSWCALYALSIEYGRQDIVPIEIRVCTPLEPMTSLFTATLAARQSEANPRPILVLSSHSSSC